MIRVLQLIDSLEAGGAERLSVTLANILSEKIDGSFLCATRSEGPLKLTIDNSVKYLFLNKKSSLDIKAILTLRTFLKKHDIDIIHAHSTSFFLATLVKLIYPKIKLVWHDHYGKSEFLEKRPKVVLKLSSLFFSHIFTVNQLLLNWSKSNLYCKKVEYLTNVVLLNDIEPSTYLKGVAGKRVLCLANLRPQKDHINLFKAFNRISETQKGWTLHCVGKDFNDDYAARIKQYVRENNLWETIYFYDSRSDIKHILSQCDIGVLSSKSEGLPIALLEYGIGKLGVITTDVGDCNLVIDKQDKGLMVVPENDNVLFEALAFYIKNENERKNAANNLKNYVETKFSKNAIFEQLLKAYQNN